MKIQMKYWRAASWLLLLAFSLPAGAVSRYDYQAEVKGMVCAFCAYSVSKNIGSLPGVDAASVDVDLKSGRVVFSSTRLIAQQQLASVFIDSGFSLVSLQQSATPIQPRQYQQQPAFEASIELSQLAPLSPLLETLGNLAASTPSRLRIEAPADQQAAILKPLLMGRQQVIHLEFVPVTSTSVSFKLFFAL